MKKKTLHYKDFTETREDSGLFSRGKISATPLEAVNAWIAEQGENVSVISIESPVDITAGGGGNARSVDIIRVWYFEHLAPVFGAVFECVDTNGVIGTTAVPVKRIEHQDDGSITVVIDYWPPVSPIARA